RHGVDGRRHERDVHGHRDLRHQRGAHGTVLPFPRLPGGPCLICRSRRALFPEVQRPRPPEPCARAARFLLSPKPTTGGFPMPKISKAKILILATDGFEQSELEVPREKLKAAGALVHVAAPKERKDKKEIRGWKNKDWGTGVPVDREL